MRRSNEPLAWSLFGAGGMLLAFFGPAVICGTLVLGIVAAEQPDVVYGNVVRWLAYPLAKLLFVAFVSLSLYHTGHRLYHGLHDLHITLPKTAMLLLFYGGATVLSVICAMLIVRV